MKSACERAPSQGCERQKFMQTGYVESELSYFMAATAPLHIIFHYALGVCNAQHYLSISTPGEHVCALSARGHVSCLLGHSLCDRSRRMQIARSSLSVLSLRRFIVWLNVCKCQRSPVAASINRVNFLSRRIAVSARLLGL